jgi:hypothetical protein
MMRSYNPLQQLESWSMRLLLVLALIGLSLGGPGSELWRGGGPTVLLEVMAGRRR